MNQLQEHIQLPEAGPQANNWFLSWLPTPPKPSPIDEIRRQLQAVTGHLLDPSAAGIRACLPHLERAVDVFGGFTEVKKLPVPDAALDALRADLAQAALLFENAYTLQAAWAAQQGLNLDGTVQQLLYGRPGALAEASRSLEQAHTWQG